MGVGNVATELSLVAGVGGADDDGDAIELLHYITSVNHTKTQVFSLLGFCFIFLLLLCLLMSMSFVAYGYLEKILNF